MRKEIKRLLREGLTRRLQYLGQCDVVRKQCDVNEQYWHIMMERAKPISDDDFINNVDMTPILEEDETPESYINDSRMADPETSAYKSIWGDKPCMFFQTHGFEFIFI
jgi:hypothetical protein